MSEPRYRVIKLSDGADAVEVCDGIGADYVQTGFASKQKAQDQQHEAGGGAQRHREHGFRAPDRQRIRARLQATEFNFKGTRQVVTASFGVAGLEDHPDADFVRLLAHADTALYYAKRQGKNRIEIDGEKPDM